MSIIKTLSFVTQQKLILPFYHAVSDHVQPHLKHLYKVRSVKQFGNDLDYLLKYYQPISIEQVYNHATGIKRITKPSFFISFDDGLMEFKEFAYPILEAKGIPSALFVNSEFVDNKKFFFRFKASLLLDFIYENKNEKLINEANTVFKSMISSVDDLPAFIKGIKYNQVAFLDNLAELFEIDFNAYLAKEQPYLTTNDLKQLVNKGVHIGAHSKDHPLFMDLDESDKYSQLVDSVNWVKSHINQTLNTFSYPFTDYGISASFFNRVFNNTDPKINLTFGTAGIKKEHFSQHLQRIPIEDYTSDMHSILKHQYLYFLAKSPFFRNTIKR